MGVYIASNFDASFLIVMILLAAAWMLPGLAVIVIAVFIRSRDARRNLFVTGTLLTIGGGILALWRLFGP